MCDSFTLPVNSQCDWSVPISLQDGIEIKYEEGDARLMFFERVLMLTASIIDTE